MREVDISRLKQSSKLEPMLTGNIPGTPLYEHFLNYLPPDLPKATYDKLGCQGYARLIVGELGGPEQARIMWVEKENPINPEEPFSHAYVVPINARGSDLAYNNAFGDGVTVQEIKTEGLDRTDEILNAPWEEL